MNSERNWSEVRLKLLAGKVTESWKEKGIQADFLLPY